MAGFDDIDPVDDPGIRAMGTGGLPSSFSSYLDASGGQAWDSNPEVLLLNWAQREWDLRQALANNPAMKPLSPELANQKYGVPGSLEWKQPVYEVRARDLYHRKLKEMNDQEVLANGQVGVLGMGAGLLTGLAVSALDPINLASGFIPIVGEQRAAAWLGEAYQRYGMAGRVATHAGIGAVEGGVGAALVEPLVYGLSVDEGRDYTAMNSLENLAFGSVIGAGLHAGTGYLTDKVTGAALSDIGKTFNDLLGGAIPRSEVPIVPRQPTAMMVNRAPEKVKREALVDAIAAIVDHEGDNHADQIFARSDVEAGKAVADHESREPAINYREVGEPNDIYTGSGQAFRVQYAIAELRDIQASHNEDVQVNPSYPQELQPRDRTRQATEAQLTKYESKPNYDLLLDSPSAADGAPTVSRKGIVQGGNVRTMLLKRLFNRAENKAKADAYKQKLQDKGFDISGFDQPVLVRVMDPQTAPGDVMKFSRDSNFGTTQAMSPSEQAISDARVLPDELMLMHDGGDLDAASNRKFVNAVLSKIVVSTEELAKLITKDGRLNDDGLRRVERAILAHAFQDAKLIETLVEGSNDTNIKAIGGALVDVAPAWSAMRAEARAGVIEPGVDTTSSLLRAISVVRRARDSKANVKDLVDQVDLEYGGAIDPVTRAWIAMMFRNDAMTQGKSREKLAADMRAYTDEARKQQPGPNLFGEHNATPDEIIARQRELDRRAGGASQLDQNQPQGADAPVEPLKASEHPAGARRPAGADSPANDIQPIASSGFFGWHGSKSIFDRFLYTDELARTGDGQQVKGPGIYIAEHRLAAKGFMPADGSGALYHVHVNADKASEFLDWDAHYSEQPGPVRDILDQVGVLDLPDKTVGEQLDPRMPNGGADLLSQDLQKYGLKGIRFADGKATADAPTQNFVVFDPDSISIIARNGQPIDKRWANPDMLITNPIDLKATPEEKVQQLVALTAQTKPLVDQLLQAIDAKFGGKSKSNTKLPENILSKSHRPSIMAKKPWHGVEHIRDSFRFKTVLDDMSQLPGIIQTFLDNGFQMVKPDTAKFLAPQEWGWRIIVFDMRAPTGQLVEYYLPVPELEDAKQVKGHHLFEQWRNHDPAKLTAEERIAFDATLTESQALYNSAFEAYKTRTNQTDNDFRAIISNLETSLADRGVKSSLNSSNDLKPYPSAQALPSQLATNAPSPTTTRGSEGSRALPPNIAPTSSHSNMGEPGGTVKQSAQDLEAGLPDIESQIQVLEAQVQELNRQGVISDTDPAFRQTEEERIADRRSKAYEAAGICLATKVIT